MYNMHILECTRSLDKRLSLTSCEVAFHRKPKSESESEYTEMILTERGNDGPRVAVVTHRGARTGVDMMKEGK
jgi:hypothetical protein